MSDYSFSAGSESDSEDSDIGIAGKRKRGNAKRSDENTYGIFANSSGDEDFENNYSKVNRKKSKQFSSESKPLAFVRKETNVIDEVDATRKKFESLVDSVEVKVSTQLTNESFKQFLEDEKEKNITNKFVNKEVSIKQLGTWEKHTKGILSTIMQDFTLHSNTLNN